MIPTLSDDRRPAIVVHVFYPDLWPDIGHLLHQITTPFDLFVTHPAGLRLDGIRQEFPRSVLVPGENRGRDVAPFVTLLPELERNGYRLVCKLHTKRSPHIPVGDRWRREMFSALVGSDTVVRQILAGFERNPSWGIVAPAGHVVPREYYWSSNAARVMALAESAGLQSHKSFRYVAGSMYWIRIDALRPVLGLGLRTESFEPESGQSDGTLAHALERLIGLVVDLSGFDFAESDSSGVRPAVLSLHFQMLAGRIEKAEQSAGFDAVRELRDELSRAETRIRSLESSLSWRLTGPLRAASDAVDRFLRMLRLRGTADRR